jgi:hypothetical protein
LPRDGQQNPPGNARTTLAGSPEAILQGRWPLGAEFKPCVGAVVMSARTKFKRNASEVVGLLLARLQRSCCLKASQESFSFAFQGVWLKEQDNDS